MSFKMFSLVANILADLKNDMDICITPQTNKYLSTSNNNISQQLNAELIDLLLNVFVDHSTCFYGNRQTVQRLDIT